MPTNHRAPSLAAARQPRRASAARLAAAWLATAWLTTALSTPARAEAPPEAAPRISASAARVETQGDRVRLVFDTSGPVQVTSFAATKPDRLVVELPELAFATAPGLEPARAAKRGEALIKSFRYGLFAPGRSRIVVDLTRPARVVRAESVAAGKGARLEIDIAPTDAAGFAAAAAEHARVAVADAPAEPLRGALPTAAPSDDKPIVVLDPGHGGVDIGATSKHGEQEKNIVFEFARTLKQKIEAGGRYRVLMTRGTDVFVSLGERVRFARDHNAALFLSIHADTLAEPNVEGATVYTVSAKASDAEAAKIAEKENRADQAAGLEHKEDAEEVGDILYDLARRETRAYSRDFAQRLVDRWRDAGSLNKNPNRSAGFVVLKAHDVPSVLLELGYLSSDKDLSKLLSPEWRDRAAETTAQAVDGFFAARSRAAQAPATTPAATPTVAPRPQ